MRIAEPDVCDVQRRVAHHDEAQPILLIHSHLPHRFLAFDLFQIQIALIDGVLAKVPDEWLELVLLW